MTEEELNTTWNDSPIAEQARGTSRIQKQIQRLMAQEAAGKERNYLYYQEMKKTDRDKYLSPAIQIQMHDDAANNQDTFMNGVSDD